MHVGRQQTQWHPGCQRPGNGGAKAQSVLARIQRPSHQKIVFAVLCDDAQPNPARTKAVGVPQAEVEREVFQAGLDLGRTQRKRHRNDSRVARPQHGTKTRCYRHGSGHRAQSQRALRPGGSTIEILAQQFLLVQHAPRASKYPLSFFGETDEITPACDDRRSEFGLQRAQGVG